jgi:hypothetical protein
MADDSVSVLYRTSGRAFAAADRNVPVALINQQSQYDVHIAVSTLLLAHAVAGIRQRHIAVPLVPLAVSAHRCWHVISDTGWLHCCIQ